MEDDPSKGKVSIKKSAAGPYIEEIWCTCWRFSAITSVFAVMDVEADVPARGRRGGGEGEGAR